MSEHPKAAFDHCYRFIASNDIYQSFENLGFQLNPEPVIHPGRLKCQFLHFKSANDSIIYLEFIFRDETIPLLEGESDNSTWNSGFALKVQGGLQELSHKFKEDFSNLGPDFIHRNYNRGETGIKPGWNFLTFEKPLIEDVYVWLIEYELRTDRTEEERYTYRQKSAALANHPNGARSILGFLWNGSVPDNYQNFVQISRCEVNGSELHLEGGTVVSIIRETDPIFSYFAHKRNNFLAVVIGVDSLEKFKQASAAEEIPEIFGRKAVRIKLDDTSWDIVAVEGN